MMILSQVFQFWWNISVSKKIENVWSKRTQASSNLVITNKANENSNDAVYSDAMLHTFEKYSV